MFEMPVLLKSCKPEKEVFDWLDNNVAENVSSNKISSEKLYSWMKISERSERGDLHFSSSALQIEESDEIDLLTREISFKNQLQIIARCNPFNKILRAGFRRRSSVQIANLDWLVKFSEPLDQKGNSLIDDENEGLCFSDIYGRFSGFVEYIEWRKRIQSRSVTKIDLTTMNQQTTCDNSLKIFDQQTLDTFIEYTRKSEVGKRLHLIVATHYREPGHMKIRKDVEVVVKHSTLSYCLLAMTMLRPNGTFIMKMYRSQELFTFGLVYLMYRCFDKISMVKPNVCRPGRPEMYLACKWKKHNDQTEVVRQCLYDVYMKLNEVRDTHEDVTQLVPIEVLKADKAFFEYIFNQNDKFLHEKLITWQCVRQYSNVQLTDPRQSDFKKRCLRLWDIEGYKGMNPTIRTAAENWRRKDVDSAATAETEQQIYAKDFRDGALESFRSREFDTSAGNWRQTQYVRGTEAKVYTVENWRTTGRTAPPVKEVKIGNWRSRKE